MKILTGSSEGQILDTRRPIIASSSEVSGTHTVSAHRHPRGQLLYAVSGSMRVAVGFFLDGDATHWRLGATRLTSSYRSVGEPLVPFFRLYVNFSWLNNSPSPSRGRLGGGWGGNDATRTANHA